MAALAMRPERAGARPEQILDQIIGCSRSLRVVLDEIESVAATNSTVLILGETGTGKELLARAVHELSDRKGRPFVKVNGAAIPAELLESEMFGHEKGAFTGAVAQKIGRFEAADSGTLFLDEVGDIPLALQAKLLRVLQEQEFERLGSYRTHHVDVRLVAATNRDLRELVEQREFRADLYYRLNVFPVMLPPLRERSEDVPMLVRHFTALYAERMHKNIDVIPQEVMDVLEHYSWPGNIRELQNFIERSVILSTGCVLRAPLEDLRAARGDNNAITFEDKMREHILETLRETNWVVGGAYGAAARLGLPRTTLLSKMQKLGIPSRPQLQTA